MLSAQRRPELSTSTTDCRLPALRTHFDEECKKHPVAADLGPSEKNFHNTRLVLVPHIWGSCDGFCL